MIFFMCAIWCLICIQSNDTKAAEKPNLDDYKALIIHRVIQLTRWPNELEITEFKVAVYGSSSSYIQGLNHNYKKQNIRGKKVNTIAFNPFTDTVKINVLFVSHSKVDDLAKIAQALKGKKILIISDNSQDKRHVMVNLTRPSKQTIGFEINRSNIILEDLEISKDVILAGGSELDAAKIYRETTNDLAATKKILTDKELKLRELEAELIGKIKTIKESSKTLNKIELKLTSSRQSLISKNAENSALVEKININTDKLKQQQQTLSRKENELTIKNLELTDKSNELQGKTSKLNLVEKKVSKQETTIESQKLLITATSATAFLLLIMGVISYKFYSSKKKSSKLIEEKNQELGDTITKLNLTQKSLIESEKMASLGGMVAGIAHEVNTPAGIALTSDSSLLIKTLEIKKIFEEGSLRKEQFSEYLSYSMESTELSITNIKRMAAIIKTFKKVAVDQTNNELRKFILAEYVNEVLNSLDLTTEDTNHTIQLHCPENISLYSYAGAFAQIISILVSNSLVHGFSGIDKGTIDLTFSEEGENLIFLYEDNGKGANDDVINNIFEPFYTTSRGAGNSGLGAHILYNLVTQLLKGSVECRSREEQGLSFKFTIPEKPNLPNH